MPPDGRSGASTGPLRRCRPALGTFVDIAIFDAGDEARDVGERGVAATNAAFAAIERVASLMSFHDPDSELSRLNAAAFGRAVRVDSWTFDVLSEAAALFAATDGLFDCAVGGVLVERGLLPRHPNASAAADARATFAEVVLHEGVVAFRRPLCLDLGGIAKGYAVDRAVEALRAGGVRSAVVNAGGDLCVLGDTAMPIRLRVADGGVVLAGTLADGAIATSCAFDAERPGPVQASSALVDPRRRRIVDGARTYSVVASTATRADALTKVLAATGRSDLPCLPRLGAVAHIH